MSAGQSSHSFVRREALPMVDREVQAHLARVGDPTLVTVAHTPNGIVTHTVAAETSSPPEVRMEQGHVVTKHVTEDYGVLLAVLGGPAIVEIALHRDQEQRAAYARAIDAVDGEAAAHAVTAIRETAMAIMQSLGVVVEEPQDASDEEEPT